MRNVLMVWVLSLMLFAQSAHAATLSDAEIENAIQVFISQRHPKDTPDQWRALGARTPTVIIGMYERSKDQYEKIRLMAGLGAFTSAEAGDFLQAQAKETSSDSLRQTAVTALGRSQGARATETLGNFLTNQDPDTRYAAAAALQEINTERAQKLLELYRSQEKATWVLDKLKGQTSDLPKSLKPVASTDPEVMAQNMTDARTPSVPPFSGKFRGFWIVPGKNVLPGAAPITSSNAELELVYDKPQALSGKLKVDKLQQDVTLTVQAGLNPKFAQGQLKAKAPETLSQELVAELRREAGVLLLELRAKKTGATGIFRRME